MMSYMSIHTEDQAVLNYAPLKNKGGGFCKWPSAVQVDKILYYGWFLITFISNVWTLTFFANKGKIFDLEGALSLHLLFK